MNPRLYRIGQIVPSSNTTMETEIPALLQAHSRLYPANTFTFHSSRMRMRAVSAAELAAMNREATRCVAELADAAVDVMSTACLVAIMAMGDGAHRPVEQELTATARANGCQAPVLTAAGALIEGLNILAAKKIALIAPYLRPLTQRVAAYIENEGFEVVDARALEIEDNLTVGRLDPRRLLTEVERLHTAQADVVVLSACVQMPSLPVLQQAEDRLGLPVISTAVCVARALLQRLDLPPQAPQAGALLAAHWLKAGASGSVRQPQPTLSPTA